MQKCLPMKKNQIVNASWTLDFRKMIQVAVVIISITGIFACKPTSGDTGKIIIPERDITPLSITVSVSYDGVTRTFSEKIIQ